MVVFMGLVLLWPPLFHVAKALLLVMAFFGTRALLRSQKHVRFFSWGIEIRPQYLSKRRYRVLWRQVRSVRFDSFTIPAEYVAWRYRKIASWDALRISWSRGHVDILASRPGFLRCVEVLRDHVSEERFNEYVRLRLHAPGKYRWATQLTRAAGLGLGGMALTFLCLILLANYGKVGGPAGEPLGLVIRVFFIPFLFIGFGLSAYLGVKVSRRRHAAEDALLRSNGPAQLSRKKGS